MDKIELRIESETMTEEQKEAMLNYIKMLETDGEWKAEMYSLQGIEPPNEENEK